MPTISELLLRHAGLQFHEHEADIDDSLIELIWSTRNAPDDIVLPDTAAALEKALAAFLKCVFELDQQMRDRRHVYAVSRIGCEFSNSAMSCNSFEGANGWLRLRLILDISWDAILAGDMQPYPEMVGHELRARGIGFTFT